MIGIFNRRSGMCLYWMAISMSFTPIGATCMNSRSFLFISSTPAKLPFSKTYKRPFKSDLRHQIAETLSQNVALPQDCLNPSDISCGYLLIFSAINVPDWTQLNKLLRGQIEIVRRLCMHLCASNEGLWQVKTWKAPANSLSAKAESQYFLPVNAQTPSKKTLYPDLYHTFSDQLHPFILSTGSLPSL